MPRNTRKSLDFEAMIQNGENPLGFTAVTPNGTAHCYGTGWNRREPYTAQQLSPDLTRPAGRSNRTGE